VDSFYDSATQRFSERRITLLQSLNHSITESLNAFSDGYRKMAILTEWGIVAGALANACRVHAGLSPDWSNP
jgi:hypothetical protein